MLLQSTFIKVKNLVYAIINEFIYKVACCWFKYFIFTVPLKEVNLTETKMFPL